MGYAIKTKVENVAIEMMTIGIYPWGEGYQPKTMVQMWREQDKGFVIKMVCYEANPTAHYRIDNEPVYKDSCMEAFLNFYPEDKDAGYLNFEMNSLGTLLCQYGKTGEDRRFVTDTGIFPPRPYAVRYENRWEVTLLIEDAFLKNIYGKSEFKKGHIIKGNFYKCGDSTDIPHYGTWCNIDYPYPSFHRPEYFGELILV